MAARIRVRAPGGGYGICIEAGLLQDGARLVEEFALGGRVALGTTERVAELHGRALAERLPDAALVTMPDGERHKNMTTLAAIYSQLFAAGLDRWSTLLAMGGGVAGDIFGYAAASYMRGLRLVMAPTTLLAMVDASIGGKTAVDLPEGKNLAGAFIQPAAVLIDPQVLATLPPAEWRNGMAEVLKHGLLADVALLDPALQQPARIDELLRRAIQVKLDIVEQDPLEQGLRMHLNLGHTFAHAIERVTEFRRAHGEAVGFGLLAAALLSHTLGLCAATLVDQVEASLRTVGLPTRLRGEDAREIYAAMFADKKRRSGRLRFILLRGMNDVVMRDDVPAQAVIETLEALQERPAGEGAHRET